MKVLTPDTLGSEIARLERRIAVLENSRRSAVATVAADPPNTRDGDTWVTGATFRIRIAGVIRTVTVT